MGGAEEAVTVTAESPLLETTNGSLGQVVDSRRVAELPTPHGDPYALIGLAAGTSFMRSARLDRPFEPTHIVGYSMNGTRANRSDVTIDGLPSTSTANAGEITASFVPPQGLVQEFKVQTATFDAAFGNTEGGVTNLVLKSGTNKLHGEAYFVKTPKSLFANDFFANANNIPIADFRYTRWSAVAGGPVWIPGVYDGRGKTFFMYGYETLPEARPRNNGTPTVPSEKMRNGDFSELLALGSQYQIYNPFTRRAIGGGRFQVDPFPGNIIPQNLINPVAKNVLGFIGRPRTAGNADGTSNYQRPEMVEATEFGSNTIRIDHVLTPKQRMYGRVSWFDRNSNYNNYFDNISTGQTFRFESRQAVVDHVSTLNSTTVMNIRYGYDKFLRGDQGNPGNFGMDLTTLGFPASYNNAIPADIRKFPRFDITGYQGTGVAGEDRFTENQTAVVVLNKSMGAHSLKTGAEWRQYREQSTFSANAQTGQFNFGTTWTRGPLDNSAGAPGSLGQSFAAFLLGLPENSSFVNVDDGYNEKSSTTGIFIQDDWRIGPKFTLNAGLRYEFESPLLESSNRSVRGFDPSVAQAMEAAARAALNEAATGVSRANFNVKGGLTFPGVEWAAGDALHHAQEQLDAARGPGLHARPQDRPPRRLRHVLRVPRAAARRRHPQRVQPGDADERLARQRADVHRDAVESVHGRHPAAGRRGQRHRDVARRVGHLFRSQSEVAADAAVADRHPARSRPQVGRRGPLRRQLRIADPDLAQPQHAAESVSEHERDARPGDDRLPRRRRAESVRRADAGDRRCDVARDEHRAETAAPPLSPVRRGEQHHERGGVLVLRPAAAARSPVLERLHRRDQLHLLALRGGHRVPERGRPGADESGLGRGRAAQVLAQRHRGAARSERDAATARTCTRSPTSWWAAGRSRPSTRTRPACRSAGATSSSRATWTTSRCRSPSGP